MAVDKFPHTKRGIRRTSYPLVPCGDGMFAEWGEIIIWQKGINTLQYKGTLRPKRGRQKP